MATMNATVERVFDRLSMMRDGLTLFRHGEFLAPTEVEKKIFRLCMQDEARHVGYGTLHLKYFLKRHGG